MWYRERAVGIRGAGVSWGGEVMGPRNNHGWVEGKGIRAGVTFQHSIRAGVTFQHSIISPRFK